MISTTQKYFCMYCVGYTCLDVTLKMKAFCQMPASTATSTQPCALSKWIISFMFTNIRWNNSRRIVSNNVFYKQNLTYAVESNTVKIKSNKQQFFQGNNRKNIVKFLNIKWGVLSKQSCIPDRLGLVMLWIVFRFCISLFELIFHNFEYRW